MLVELVEDDLRFCAALEFDYNAHAVAIGFVAHVRDVVNCFVVYELGDALNERCLIYLVWNLCNDDCLTSLGQVLDGCLCANCEATTPIRVRLLDSAAAIDKTAGGKVWPFYDLQNFFQRGLRSLNQSDRCIDDLGEIVRRDVCRHSHRNSVRTVDQQVRNACRKNRGLNGGFVVVRNEIDRLLVDVGEYFAGDLSQAALGVTHRRRRIAID